ncbi:glycerophosphodiester phosphodiesterase, cytosolic [Legionella beliardensis]|uniref:Glycerophosphodiester phosphodiesterase, cytosolic n=1 Tax=Legionella beliardensis TaxID=91822 RepID=A0A378I3H3_9GAMM|nr:glycerophosphodiester phosphodiesterase [Legionella beliardensis]STX29251.1 glycerophosphodiester phosphodiesterase, cytosolic [Legionella beliardensis]
MQINNSVIGHRGASAYAPENTLAAFNKALTLGCNTVEFDVMLSGDGEPFVFHDEVLERTTNGKGAVGLVTAAYLETLDAGRWFSDAFAGEKIPHFKTILIWLMQNNMNANIEIKPYPGMSEQTTAAVLDCLHRFWPQEKSLPLLSSFDLTALTLCHTIAPHMPLGLLLDAWDEDWLNKAQSLGCYSIHINELALDAARIQDIKRQGYQLYVYTVNCKARAGALLNWGVDAVFSDYPDLLS